MPITRRQFTGTVAASLAALLLPKIALQPRYDLQRMLGQWCDNGTVRRYDLKAPYVMQSHAYATDSRAMARICDDGLTIDGSTRIPECTVRVWDSHWHDDGKWQPWPRHLQLVDRDDGVCPLCLHKAVPCPQCDGLGEWCVLPGDHSDFCLACHGLGFVQFPDCPLCHGRQDGPVPAAALVGNKLIGLEYVDIVNRIPDVRWQRGTYPHGPILWQSDIGISGLIMPRTKP